MSLVWADIPLPDYCHRRSRERLTGDQGMLGLALLPWLGGVLGGLGRGCCCKPVNTAMWRLIGDAAAVSYTAIPLRSHLPKFYIRIRSHLVFWALAFLAVGLSTPTSRLC